MIDCQANAAFDVHVRLYGELPLGSWLATISGALLSSGNAGTQKIVDVQDAVRPAKSSTETAP